jgi:4-hydroxythreonine-4-phosphate dehydrogenase
MENNKIKIAITQGDINGVGYEMIFKTFAEPEMLDICTPIIYGSQKAANFHKKTLGARCQLNFIQRAEDAAEGKINIVDCTNDFSHVEFGQFTETAAAAEIKSIERVLADAKANLFDAMVCSPMNMESFRIGNINFEGEKEFILKAFETKSALQEIFINEEAKLSFITENNVSKDEETVDYDSIKSKIRSLYGALRRDFRISNPRIAVISENHNSDEDWKNKITEILRALSNEGIQAFGPYQEKQFMESENYVSFDGLISFCPQDAKISTCILAEHDSIILLTGMPKVCTIPNTDSQYDIAGKGLADESMMRKAIYLAIDTCRFRNEYDLPFANPLQKLYKEKPDNGDKRRFSIPKKKEQ